MLYFAYGSNLDPAQMSSRCPGHQVVGMAVMRDHKMVFPLTSHDWGGGVAGVQMQHGAELWGMVFELNDADLAALDRYEGFRGPGDQHNLYDRETVFVELTRADDGSFNRRLRVLCYLPKQANPAPPSKRYMDAIIKGAVHHRLPDEHLAFLRAIPVAEPVSEPPAS